MSEVAKKTDTLAEQALQRAFSAFNLTFFTQDTFVVNRENPPKVYIVDFYIPSFLIIEVEGKGSSSRDNPQRDQWFQDKGFKIIHIPNRMALTYSYEIAAMIKALV